MNLVNRDFLMCSFPSLTSLLLSTLSSTTGFGFGGFFDFVNKSLGQVLATFSLSHSIFQPKIILSCLIVLICFHLSLHASLAALFNFQASLLWSLCLALASFFLASLSTDRTSVKCLPSPFLLIVCISHPSSPSWHRLVLI